GAKTPRNEGFRATPAPLSLTLALPRALAPFPRHARPPAPSPPRVPVPPPSPSRGLRRLFFFWRRRLLLRWNPLVIVRREIDLHRAAHEDFDHGAKGDGQKDAEEAE